LSEFHPAAVELLGPRVYSLQEREDDRRNSRGRDRKFVDDLDLSRCPEVGDTSDTAIVGYRLFA